MNTTVHYSTAPRPSLVTAERFAAAPSFQEYLATVAKNRDWWHNTYRLAAVGAEHAARANALATSRNLLALSEDWCGDAVNILPFVARLAEAAPQRLVLRVLGRDANPDIMQAHLTGHSRSIPVVIAMDMSYVEHGWWGPRPLPLQARAMGEWWTLPKDERRLRIRAFYARDRGRQTVDELLRLLEGSQGT